MRSAWKRTAALLLCLALLLGGCAARENIAESSVPGGTGAAPAASSASPAEEELRSGPKLSVWLTEGDALCGAAEALAEEYGRLHPELTLTLRRVSGAEELRRLAAEEWPDLLLCGEREAAALLAEGKLGAIAYPDEPAPLFREVPGCAERGYYPLGAELPVLVLREENRALLADCGSLEELCAAAIARTRADDRPFFSADSFARLFACALAQTDCPFFARRELDRENERYRALYNLLADAAFEGALVPLDEPVLSAVSRGELVCGVCGSAALSGANTEGLALLPLPPMAGCEALYDAAVSGLAVLPNAGEEAARFLAWLYAGDRAAQAALDAGLAPAVGGEDLDDDAVSAGLFAAAQQGRFFLPPEDGGFRKNGAAFEQSFRAALALLG